MTATTLPVVGARVSCAIGTRKFSEGYVREHLSTTDAPGVLVEVVHGAGDALGLRAYPAEWLTVQAVPNEAVIAALTAITGLDIEATVVVGAEYTRRETGIVGISTEGGATPLLWVTDGRGSGSGYELANIRSVTVGGTA